MILRTKLIKLIRLVKVQVSKALKVAVRQMAPIMETKLKKTPNSNKTPTTRPTMKILRRIPEMAINPKTTLTLITSLKIVVPPPKRTPIMAIRLNNPQMKMAIVEDSCKEMILDHKTKANRMIHQIKASRMIHQTRANRMIHQTKANRMIHQTKASRMIPSRMIPSRMIPSRMITIIQLMIPRNLSYLAKIIRWIQQIRGRL